MEVKEVKVRMGRKIIPIKMCYASITVPASDFVEQAELSMDEFRKEVKRQEDEFHRSLLLNIYGDYNRKEETMTTLKWRRVNSGHVVSEELARIIRDRFGSPDPLTFSRGDVWMRAFLEGFCAGSDSPKLINEIESLLLLVDRHGAVEFYEAQEG